MNKGMNEEEFELKSFCMNYLKKYIENTGTEFTGQSYRKNNFIYFIYMCAF